MSTITPCTSTSRPTASTGRIAFETDTKNIIVYDGTNWRGYANDGLPLEASSYSLELDGTDDYVELGDVPSLSGASAFSVSLWVKAPAVTSPAEALFRSGGGSNSNTITAYQSGSSLLFYIGTGSTYHGINSNGQHFADAWLHLAFVYGSSSLSMYINGSLQSTTTAGASTCPSSTVSNAGDDFTIGSYQNGASNELDGYIDDFAIFDAALTSTEVSNIKNNAIYPLAKLKHLYKFENNFNDSIGSINGTAINQAHTSTDTVRP